MVSTPLKNISQIGSSPQLRVKIKNLSNHHLVVSFDSIWFWKKNGNSQLCLPHPNQRPAVLPQRGSIWWPSSKRCLSRWCFSHMGWLDFPNCWGKQATIIIIITTTTTTSKIFYFHPWLKRWSTLTNVIFFSDGLNSFYKEKKTVAKQKYPMAKYFFVDSPSIFSTQDLGRNTKTVDQRCGGKAWMCHSK